MRPQLYGQVDAFGHELLAVGVGLGLNDKLAVPRGHGFGVNF